MPSPPPPWASEWAGPTAVHVAGPSTASDTLARVPHMPLPSAHLNRKCRFDNDASVDSTDESPTQFDSTKWVFERDIREGDDRCPFI